MNRTTRPVSARWATLVLIAASLALASCGRKGGLDLPPHGAPQTGAPQAGTVVPEAEPAKGSVFDSSYGMDRPPQAADGRKNRIFLDKLLD